MIGSISYRSQPLHRESAETVASGRKSGENWFTKGRDLTQRLITPKRILISGLIFGLPALAQALRQSPPPPAKDDAKSPESHKHNGNNGLNQTLIYALRLSASIFGALFLDRLLPEIRWGMKGEIGRPGKLGKSLTETFHPANLRLVGGLVVFNTLLESLTHSAIDHQNNTNARAGIALLGALTQISGSFGLSRLIGGEGSILGTLAAACPCCALPVCLSELISMFSAIGQFIGHFLERSPSSPKPQSVDLQTPSLLAKSPVQ